MSHTTIVEIRCNPGERAEFLARLVPMLADTRTFEGCEQVEPYTDEDDPDVVILWEKWASRENQEAYLAWRMESAADDPEPSVQPLAMRFVHLQPAE